MSAIRRPLRGACRRLAIVACLVLTSSAVLTGSASAGPALPPQLQNDCDTGGDAANQSIATPITVPVSNCTGQVGGLDYADRYKFPAAAGQVVTATMTPAPDADFGLCVIAPGAGSACGSGGKGATESVSLTAATSGEGVVEVHFGAPLGVAWLGDTYTLSISTAYPQDDCSVGGDAGGAFGVASPITLPKTNCTARLEPSEGDQEDWYQFPLDGGQTVSASMTPNASANFDVCIYNTLNAPVACSIAGVGATDSVSYTAPTTGSYRWRVHPIAGRGTYTMSVSASVSDCGTGGDAPGSFATAALITLPKTNCTAQLGGSDAQDWYQFAVSSGEEITVKMTPNPGADYSMCLTDPSGLSSWCHSGYGTWWHVATTSGNWRLNVFVESGSGSYTMSVSAGPPTQNDCGIGMDAPNGFWNAVLISLPKNCWGYLPELEDHDFYKFSVSSGQTIRVTMTPPGGTNGFDICLYNPDWTWGYCTGYPPGWTETIAHTANVSGEWRLEVYSWSGTGSYSLSVSAT